MIRQVLAKRETLSQKCCFSEVLRVVVTDCADLRVLTMDRVLAASNRCTESLTACPPEQARIIRQIVYISPPA